MSTLVLGSNSFIVVPDVNGDPITVSPSGTVPSILGGAGAPVTTPSYGGNSLYIDTTNYALYVYQSAAWHLISSAASTVTSIAGTANQITASASIGSVTLSITSNPVIPGNAGMGIPLGTSAQRPAIPTEGIIRYNTDFDVLEGYTSPYSTTPSTALMHRTMMQRKRRVWVDEFITGTTSRATTSNHGDLGWSLSATGTAVVALTTATTDHLGVITIQTGTTNGNSTRLHLGGVQTTLVMMANQIECFSYLVSIPNITTMTVLLGLGTDISNVNFGTDGVFFSYVAGTNSHWVFTTRAGSTSNAITSTVSVAAATWYLLEAFYDGTSWQAYVNGTLIATSTTNIPTVAVNQGVGITTNAGSARSIQIDYFSSYTTELGNRY